MSKKRRSKILATLLCATTMAAFYVSPQLVSAEGLYFDENDNVTTNSSGATQIQDIDGLASITFGTPGEDGNGGVKLIFDGNGQGGLKVVDSSLTADYLYLNVTDNYGNRYSLHNVLGIHRIGSEGDYVTNIETGLTGQGGMQVSENVINIFGGEAIFDNRNDGSINFNMAFNAADGMTVGNDFSIDNRGNIKSEGDITTTGTINGNVITENTINDVTLDRGEVTADEVTADGYKLTEVGENAQEAVDKTAGILRFDSNNNNTIFSSKITANGGIQANTISTTTLTATTITAGAGSLDTFTVHQAKETIDWVAEWDENLEATYTKANNNETAISNLKNQVSSFDGRITDNTSAITTNTNDISALKTNTTGMTYDSRTGTTFAQDVTATDFKINGTSLKSVADAVNDKDKGLAKTNEIAVANQGEIGTLKTNTTGMTYDSGTGTTFGQDVTATDFKIDGTSLKSVADAVNDKDKGLAKTNEIAVANQGEIGTLKTKTHGFDETGETLELTTINATNGTIGGVTFNSGVVTGLTAINGNSITVAGNTLTSGNFNGVAISDDEGKATINGISIY